MLALKLHRTHVALHDVWSLRKLALKQHESPLTQILSTASLEESDTSSRVMIRPYKTTEESIHCKYISPQYQANLGDFVNIYLLADLHREHFYFK